MRGRLICMGSGGFDIVQGGHQARRCHHSTGAPNGMVQVMKIAHSVGAGGGVEEEPHRV